jgi:hypothetical protein
VFVLLALSVVAPARAGVVIERVLAVVEGQPVMLSEVRLAERVRGVARPEALEGLIDEQLMSREAARLPQATPTGEEEERAFRSLLGSLGGDITRVPEGDLRQMARRQTAILKYVEFRFRPQVRVDDTAVRQAYEEATAGQPAPPAFAEVVDELRARLEEQDLNRRIEDWVKELRRAAEVRYVDEVEVPAEAPVPAL